MYSENPSLMLSRFRSLGNGVPSEILLSSSMSSNRGISSSPSSLISSGSLLLGSLSSGGPGGLGGSRGLGGPSGAELAFWYKGRYSRLLCHLSIGSWRCRCALSSSCF